MLTTLIIRFPVTLGCEFTRRTEGIEVSFYDKRTGAVLARASQPLVGPKNKRSAEDEHWLDLLRTAGRPLQNA
eukprot:6427422-Pyramimonas_sp.AAC.1